jgi:hypothetical protein
MVRQENSVVIEREDWIVALRGDLAEMGHSGAVLLQSRCQRIEPSSIQ